MACRSPKRRRARARGRGIIRCRPAPSASPAARRPMRLRATPIVVLAIGTRLQDFTTGSHSLFPQARLVAINVNPYDASQMARVARHRRRRGDARRARDAAFGMGGGCRRGRPARSARRVRGAKSYPAIVDVRDVDAAGASLRGRGDRRGSAAPTLRRGRHRRLRRRLASRRAAQALARGASRRLSRRVWVLVHGLRDRGRHRRQDGETGARSDRAGRRRQLSDAQFRNRDVGDAGHEARRRRARQPRLRLHPSAAAGVRRRGLQQPDRRLIQAGSRRASRRLRRPREIAGRAGRACRLDRRARR